jgi:ribonuclease R
VHRSLKKLIHQKKGANKNKGGKSLDEIADETSQKERRAMEAERFIVKRKQCWFLKKHVGDVYSGVISGMTANGLFIELPEFCTDGFLPIEDLKEDYSYDESRMCLRKRPGHSVLHLGDPVQVQIVRVSVEDNQIQFVES